MSSYYYYYCSYYYYYCSYYYYYYYYYQNHSGFCFLGQTRALLFKPRITSDQAPKTKREEGPPYYRFNVKLFAEIG